MTLAGDSVPCTSQKSSRPSAATAFVPSEKSWDSPVSDLASILTRIPVPPVRPIRIYVIHRMIRETQVNELTFNVNKFGLHVTRYILNFRNWKMDVTFV